jgi:S-adenosylmethionine synthetase
MNRKKITSESVTEGHPDKICDRIADSILDALLAQDGNARCACEVTVQPASVQIMGEITSDASVNYGSIARACIESIGYTRSVLGFDAMGCKVQCTVHQQSPDIAMGVGPHTGGDLRLDELGAGDQGIMFGYACDETPELMPAPIMMAHALTKRLSELRKNGGLPGLRPDGKAQVTVEYQDGSPWRIDTVVVSAQHDEELSIKTLRNQIEELVIRESLPAQWLDQHTKIYINPTGRFVLGGPAADTGLTGRKIIADTYGGCARHGGGAFSGKDPTKVDRTAAYMARYIAKNVVAAGLAQKCEISIAYAIGIAHPIAVAVDTFGTGKLDDEALLSIVQSHFDLRVGAMIKRFSLQRPIYAPVSVYGHFGRPELALPWESLDAVETLRGFL